MTTSISASLWAYPKYIKDFLLPFQTLRGKEASCRGLALENWGIVWSLFVIHPLWCLLRCIVLLLSFNNLLIYRYHSWSLPYSSIKPPEVWRPHEIILVLSSHLGATGKCFNLHLPRLGFLNQDFSSGLHISKWLE